MRIITPRLGRMLLAVVVALVGFGAWRSLKAMGIFAGVPAPVGICRSATALTDAHDIAADPLRDALFIAGDNAILLGKLSDPSANPVRLKGTPTDFHPQAISLYRGADGTSLMAVNRKANGRLAVDIFTPDFSGAAPKLVFTSAIEGGLLTSGNDIAAIAANRFYLTNGYGSKSATGRWLEETLVLPLSNLLYFDGASFRASVDRIALPDGVAVDGDHIYVASAAERRVLAFGREPFRGALQELGSLSLPIRPGKMALDGKGGLLVAGPVKMSGASQILRVALGDDGAPVSYSALYAGQGEAVAAAQVGGQLFAAGAGLICQ